MKTDYCTDFTSYHRQKSWEVTLGKIPMGNSHPIRIQTMTNTDSNNTEATVKQIINIVRQGADYVRLTVPNLKSAENLSAIKDELRKANVSVPLIADIHFNPELAVVSARYVEKVRINPGNYGFRGKSEEGSNNSEQFDAEHAKLREQFVALLEVCKKYSTTIRIGTNHGSLSSRILNKYGDTPEGMVESAMEFLRICKDEKFFNTVVSMKASNTRIMVYATRLLVSKMKSEDMFFPIHLGVTEAGEGEDGRIKSAVGIGTLLYDGIGDTIRVSLTEDPENEIPVARKMIDHIASRSDHEEIEGFGNYPVSSYEYAKNLTEGVENIGGENHPRIIQTVRGEIDLMKLRELGWIYSDASGWSFSDLAPDFLHLEDWPGSIPLPEGKSIILSFKNHGSETWEGKNSMMSLQEYFAYGRTEAAIQFVSVNAFNINSEFIEKIKADHGLVLVVESNNKNSLADLRSAAFRLINHQCKTPVVFYKEYKGLLKEDFQLCSALDLGGLFIDGLGDGIWLDNHEGLNDREVVSTSFGILQASRVRISKTEYISCPSCGRTLFDLQDTTRKIRERTSHLRGLKIGIMGCIVNGPGEMADADYGYVGGARGRITLYKEKKVIKKNVPEENAVSELIELIKENGDWVDP